MGSGVHGSETGWGVVAVASGKVSSVTMASGVWVVVSFLGSGGGGGGDDNCREGEIGGLAGCSCGGTGAGSTLILHRRKTQVSKIRERKLDRIAYMCREGADLVPYLLVEARARGVFFNVARI
jgi:hypothetical protein